MTNRDDFDDKNTKLACFDYDWTLVKPKDGRTFPVDVDDWKWTYASVPDKLLSLYKEKYSIHGSTRANPTHFHTLSRSVLELWLK